MNEIQTAPPLADTSDMVGMHRVFRNAFGSAVELIGSCNPDDGERVGLIAGYYENVLALLHVHHDGEDRLVTPRLVQRATPEEVREVQRVAAQHGDVRVAIEDAETLVATWRSAPAIETATVASTALASLGASLGAHLDDEEQTVLPIAARYLTAPEWGELPAHGMRDFTGDKLWLILGLIREQMTSAQLADMDAHMPPPVASFWNAQGEPMFLEYVAKLRR